MVELVDLEKSLENFLERCLEKWQKKKIPEEILQEFLWEPLEKFSQEFLKESLEESLQESPMEYRKESLHFLFVWEISAKVSEKISTWIGEKMSAGIALFERIYGDYMKEFLNNF